MSMAEPIHTETPEDRLARMKKLLDEGVQTGTYETFLLPYKQFLNVAQHQSYFDGITDRSKRQGYGIPEAITTAHGVDHPVGAKAVHARIIAQQADIRPCSQAGLGRGQTCGSNGERPVIGQRQNRHRSKRICQTFGADDVG